MTEIAPVAIGRTGIIAVVNGENLTRLTSSPSLNTHGIQMQSEQVPVFNCIFYVSRIGDGGMRARVANLPGIERTAATEREALTKVVSAFKQSVIELMKTSQPIPWIEPIAAAESGELQRFIPVHL